jgi:mRNA interferase RelE/StbE
MPYRISYAGHALRDMRNLDPGTRRRINDALARFAATDLGDVRRLQGIAGIYRLRIGKWRLFFRLGKPNELEVLAIENRGQAY